MFNTILAVSASCPLMKPVEDRHIRMPSELLPNGLSSDPACVSVKSENHCCIRSTLVDTSSSAVTSSVSTLSNPAMVLECRHTSIGTSTEMVPRVTENNRSAKVNHEFAVLIVWPSISYWDCLGLKILQVILQNLGVLLQFKYCLL